MLRTGYMPTSSNRGANMVRAQHSTVARWGSSAPPNPPLTTQYTQHTQHTHHVPEPLGRMGVAFETRDTTHAAIRVARQSESTPHFIAARDPYGLLRALEYKYYPVKCGAYYEIPTTDVVFERSRFRGSLQHLVMEGVIVHQTLHSPIRVNEWARHPTGRRALWMAYNDLLAGANPSLTAIDLMGICLGPNSHVHQAVRWWSNRDDQKQI